MNTLSEARKVVEFADTIKAIFNNFNHISPTDETISKYIVGRKNTNIVEFLRWLKSNQLTPKKGVFGEDYDIFDFDCTGLLHIEAYFDGRFEDDEQAVEQAKEDGVKIIPMDDPIFGEKGDFAEALGYDCEVRDWGWVDTPENRTNIKNYIKEYGPKSKNIN